MKNILKLLRFYLKLKKNHVFLNFLFFLNRLVIDNFAAVPNLKKFLPQN